MTISHVLYFDLKQAFPLNSSCHDEEKKKTIRGEKLEEKFDDSSYKVLISSDGLHATVKRRNIERLIEVVQKHIKIVSFAFPSLSQEADFKVIESSFLRNEVLDKSNWRAHELFQQKQLDEALKILQEKTSEYLQKKLSNLTSTSNANDDFSVILSDWQVSSQLTLRMSPGGGSK